VELVIGMRGIRIEPSLYTLKADLQRLLDAVGGPVEPELIVAYREPLDSSPKTFPDAIVLTVGLTPQHSYSPTIAILGVFLLLVSATLVLIARRAPRGS
jgi:hypothetical protein